MLVCWVSSCAAENGRALYLPRLVHEAVAVGLPAELADAVAMVETGYRPDAVGTSGEIGLMQIMPATALQLGFHGTLAELADPVTNIRLGVRYLARAWAAGDGDICRALMKYRAGLGEEVMSALSVSYCSRAIGWLRDGESTLPASLAHPQSSILPPVDDPHVVAMPHYYATATSLLSEVAGALQPMPRATPRPLYAFARTMADRNATLSSHFRSHLRLLAMGAQEHTD